MPITERSLVRIVRQFQGGIFFIDELHRGTKRDQEMLLPLLESGQIFDRRGRSHHVGWMTVVAATTEPHLVIPPLWDRFVIRPTFAPYSDDDLTQIVLGMGDRMGVSMDSEVVGALGRASGGVPRRARTLILAYRDLAIYPEQSLTYEFGVEPSRDIVDAVLDLCQVDRDGLTNEHIQYLDVLAGTGGTAGLNIMTRLLNLHQSIVMEIERILVLRGLLEYSPAGRDLTAKGWARVRPQERTSPRGTQQD